MWDGSRLELHSDMGEYIIGYHIQLIDPADATQGPGASQDVDNDLEAPVIWKVEADPAAVTVYWRWNGDPNEITSFELLIDGKTFHYLNKAQRQDTFFLGTHCGKNYSFQVAAVGAVGAVATSGAYPYTLPDCGDLYAEVAFESLVITAYDDGEPSPCDSANLMFNAWMTHVGEIYEPVEPYQVQCHQEYQFTQFPYGQVFPAAFQIPIDTSQANPEFEIIVDFWDTDHHWQTGTLADFDWICKYWRFIKVKDLPMGTTNFSETCPDPNHLPGMDGNGNPIEYQGTITLNYTVRLYTQPSGP
jgi:hypothetical protein